MANSDKIYHIECNVCDLADKFVFEHETKDEPMLKTQLEAIHCRCGALLHDYKLVHCLKEDCELCECVWFMHGVFPKHFKKQK